MIDQSQRLWTLLHYETRQREEEGCDPAAISSIRQSLAPEAEQEELAEAYALLEALPVQDSFPFTEPTAWSGIITESPGFSGRAVSPSPPNPEALFDRMQGAWTGRAAGCVLGKPLERGPYMQGSDGVQGWQNIRTYLKHAKAWPLDGFVPDAGKVGDLDVGCLDSCRGNVRFVETDDDIRYTVLGLMVLERYGADFTTADVASTWFTMLPMGQTFTAEREAYRNLASLIDSVQVNDINLDWIRTHHNPFREWIGAQIRADGWGYGAAGQPALAAELAYRDAALSHVKNGIYGEMLFAGTIATAFFQDSPLDALREGLRFIPSASRLAKAVDEAIGIGLGAKDLDELHGKLWDRWGHYDGVHTINNAALVAAALAYGGNDFERTIVAAVTGGWDTDCNGATAGSVWGATYGYKALPRKWVDPFNDTLYAAIPGFHPIAISECARRSVVVAEHIRGSRRRIQEPVKWASGQWP